MDLKDSLTFTSIEEEELNMLLFRTEKVVSGTWRELRNSTLYLLKQTYSDRYKYYENLDYLSFYEEVCTKRLIVVAYDDYYSTYSSIKTFLSPRPVRRLVIITKNKDWREYYDCN